MRDEIIDFTMLQKKGILQRAKELEAKEKNLAGSNRANSEGFVDFTSSASSGSSAAANTGSASVANPFASFFGAVDSSSSASSGSSGSAAPTTGYYGSSSTASAVSSTGSGNADVANMKVQIENAEYKLERALERIDKLERKISEKA